MQHEKLLLNIHYFSVARGETWGNANIKQWVTIKCNNPLVSYTVAVALVGEQLTY